MALHKHSSGHKPHISAKASAGLGKFREEMHKRDAEGKFADKPGAGDDAPKKARPGKSSSQASSSSPRAPLTASKLNGSYTLFVLAKGNPKKGTAAARYSLYKEGMTIDDYVKAVEKAGLGDKKQALRDVLWDMKQGWIKSSKPGAKNPASAVVAGGAGGAAGAGLLASSTAVQAEAIVAKAAAPIVLEAKPASLVALENKLAPEGDFVPKDAQLALSKAKNFEDVEFYSQEGEADLHAFGESINKISLKEDDVNKAVKFYTGESYFDLNHKLRNGQEITSFEKDIVTGLDKVIDKSDIPENVVLHRVVPGLEFATKMKNLKPGDTLVQGSYMSTTLHPDAADAIVGAFDPDEASDAITWVRILGRKGSKAAFLEPVTSNEGEFEVLLPRGAKLQFIGKDNDGSYMFDYAASVSKPDLPSIQKLAPIEALPPAPSVTTPISSTNFKKVGTADSPSSAAGFTKTGPQMGSNEGGVYTGPDGSNYYIKTAKSIQHAENELLANALYEKLGVNTLKPEAFDLNGKLATGSKMTTLTKFNPNNPLHLADAQAAYAQHAFVANWDSVGLSYDNLAYVDGKLTMLDAGGALKYRAQGAAKPNFNGDVTELDTLKSPVNPQAQKVFGSITAEGIAKSAQPVLALTDADIDDIVSSAVKDAGRAAQFSQVLKARRDDIAKRVESLTKTETASKAVVQDVIEQAAVKSPPTPAVAAATAAPTPPPAPQLPTPPASGTKSTVPLAKGTPVAVSSNPDPLPLGSTIAPSTKLHLEVVGNPKISSAAQRFALYKDGMTVQDYVDAVGDKKQALKDIAWDMKQGWISASKPSSAPTPSVSAAADEVYKKLMAGAAPPAPVAPSGPAAVKAAVESSGVSLAKTSDVKAVVAAAESSGALAEGTAVVVPTPSPKVKFETLATGTTAMDTTSKQGLPPTDETISVGVYSNSPILATQMKQNGLEIGTNSGISPQSQSAGDFIYKAGEQINKSGAIVVGTFSKGKFVGAMSAQVSGEVATITAAGSFKSGSGAPMLEKLVDQAVEKGATKISVKTASPEFYEVNGFKPTSVKDTYELDISKLTNQKIAAKAAAGDIEVKPAAPLQAQLQSAEKAPAPASLPASSKTSMVGPSSVVTEVSGHKFDAPTGLGVTALDPKTLQNLGGGSNNQTSILTNPALKSHNTKIAEKIDSLTAAADGKTLTSEITALKKTQDILDDYVNEKDNKNSNMLFGFSTGNKGDLKGSISAVMSSETSSVVITGHASLSAGGGTTALSQLIAKAQAAGKKEILVKSGMVEYYKSQGFTASVDANGYLSLKIDPLTYKSPSLSSFNTYGSYPVSAPSEAMLKQIIKKGADADKSYVDPSKYKTILSGTDDYVKYKKDTYDAKITDVEKAKTKYYTGSGYSALNKTLYEDHPMTDDLKEMMYEMDKAIAKTSLKQDTLLWRSMGLNTKSLLDHLEVGDVFAPANYTSTSVTKGVFGSGSSHKVTMKIYANKGAKGIPVGSFSNYKSEDETILPRDAPLRFLGLSPEGYYEFEYK